MAEQHTTYTPPGGSTTVIETRRSSGMGIVLFILGGVVAVLAILWFTLGAPDSASRPAEGETNITIENAPPPAADATPEGTPAPAPMTPTEQPAPAPEAVAPEAPAPTPAPVEN
ncbi:hypothetical protein SAMN04488103_101556 [Gemmobacter aquatilis]|uniref:Uncharacterized protein n=1 Tax=Gemmobacter aquatilis TaxID=933059 RepID=A0A1H7ZK91_9RHOB|nr:hypothetical protein [Gemmobacter aquatilis]SEM58735.1 hypothetical protein SAMN04488103_101556 [Gemmobacter aquatilis]